MLLLLVSAAGDLLEDVGLFTIGLLLGSVKKVASLGVLISLSPAVFFL